MNGIIFSLDGNDRWLDHRASINYTAIRAISPGRLLYMHDGQTPGTQRGLVRSASSLRE